MSRLGEHTISEVCQTQALVTIASGESELQGRGVPQDEKEAVEAAGGHAAHVTKVRFTADDLYLITVGGFNRSVIQYKFKRLGVDENGVGVVVLPDMDIPPTPPTGTFAPKDSDAKEEEKKGDKKKKK